MPFSTKASMKRYAGLRKFRRTYSKKNYPVKIRAWQDLRMNRFGRRHVIRQYGRARSHYRHRRKQGYAIRNRLPPELRKLVNSFLFKKKRGRKLKFN